MSTCTKLIPQAKQFDDILLRCAPITTNQELFLPHNIEWEQSEHLGLDPIISIIKMLHLQNLWGGEYYITYIEVLYLCSYLYVTLLSHLVLFNNIIIIYIVDMQTNIKMSAY